MQDTPSPSPSLSPSAVQAAKRTAVRRRAKRGLIAGYIHEISGRHGSTAIRTPELAEPAREPAPAT